MAGEQAGSGEKGSYDDTETVNLMRMAIEGNARLDNSLLSFL